MSSIPQINEQKDIDDVNFTLNDGESYTFDFFEIIVGGFFGGGTATVEATLAFDNPASASSGTGSGNWFTFLGIVSSGSLAWTVQPDPVVLSTGEYFEIEFSDIQDFGIGNSAMVDATITAHGAPVIEPAPIPESATMLLLGSGLMGLAGFRRKKQGSGFKPAHSS